MHEFGNLFKGEYMRLPPSLPWMLFLPVVLPAASLYRNIPLKRDITSVQPMTGIVLWTDNEANRTDAIQLEYSYMLYNSVVSQQGVYDWTVVDRSGPGLPYPFGRRGARSDNRKRPSG